MIKGLSLLDESSLRDIESESIGSESAKFYALRNFVTKNNLFICFSAEAHFTLKGLTAHDATRIVQVMQVSVFSSKSFCVFSLYFLTPIL